MNVGAPYYGKKCQLEKQAKKKKDAEYYNYQTGWMGTGWCGIAI